MEHEGRKTLYLMDKVAEAERELNDHFRKHNPFTAYDNNRDKFTLSERLISHARERLNKNACDSWQVFKLSNGKYSYFNFREERMMEADFYEAYDFFDGLAAVMICYESKWGDEEMGPYNYIDSTGKQAFEGDFDSCNFFSEGLVHVNPVDSETPDVFYIDKDGKRAFPGTYVSANPFLYGLALVEFSEGDWGYINKKGERIQTETQ